MPLLNGEMFEPLGENFRLNLAACARETIEYRCPSQLEANVFKTIRVFYHCLGDIRSVVENFAVATPQEMI